MGRSPATNPFTPGFGNLPRVFAGRKTEFADLELLVDRLAQGIYEQVRLVTGDRGVGKTTLLRELEEEQREAGRWVVRASATRGDAVIGRLCRGLATLLHERDVAAGLARGARDALRRLAGISLGPGGVTVELHEAGTSDRADELEELLAAVGGLARERGTVLLLLVDEAQNIGLDALGDLFHALQEVQGRVVATRDGRSGALRRDALPVGAVVAGLPGLVGRLKNAGSTFGERSKPLPLRGFGEGDMREGLRALAREGGATFDADALELLMAACGGYPYFLHLIGSQMWNAGDGAVITRADAAAGLAAARPLVTDFYEQRLRELGPLQRRYLHAAARLEDRARTTGAIAAALGRRSEQLGSTQQALTAQHGLLRPTGDGRLEFALPGLADHLRATADDA
ncbi:ATP-binding protein [Egicoccus halophilus]|uniref:ATPase n=1 Tax=Egicoccus halophilus TaxID=1670830 RepID=A0A8J3A9C5_9ACTN|nr:ATP-binding protein [Egicoccus halophilus]GGI07381.1 ATPase [Egicoccus halophilus]